MAIYVQSRGISQENDYRWLRIKKNTHLPEIPPILKRPIPGKSGNIMRVTDLIDSQKPSIVVARSDGELLLLVTALKAREERTDFMGRPIRNSVAWVDQDTEENERIFRSLTVRALRGELETEVDRAISIEGEYGFSVDLEAIKKLAAPEQVDFKEPELTVRISNNSIESKESLALELEQHCLPQRNGFLIVVTSIKTKSALLQASVWRGLSLRVEEKGAILPEKKTRMTSIVRTAIAIAIATFILITILGLKLMMSTESQPNPKPSIPSNSLKKESIYTDFSLNYNQAKEINYFY